MRVKPRIRIKMGGYLNRDDGLMSTSELNAEIMAIQEENEAMRESIVLLNVHGYAPEALGEMLRDSGFLDKLQEKGLN